MLTLITGASAGLGAEMARQLAARGHDIVLTARRVDRLEALQAELTARHPERRITLAALDVNDHDAVFATFAEHGPFERVIVNAGLGKGQPIGTGQFDHNRNIMLTNVVAALAQVEAAMEQFREHEKGHLVLIASVAAVRGQPGSAAVYAASKRAMVHLAEGLRMETLGTDIDVTAVLPGYIRSEMTEDAKSTPFMVDTEPGVRAIVGGIEKRAAHVYAPTLPWKPLSVLMRLLPLPLLAKLNPSRER